jgi:hypothetical protein
MADQDLVKYIRENIAEHDLTTIKAQLLKDGMDSAEIDAAITEVSGSEQGPRSNLATFALLGGVGLLIVAVFFAIQSPSTPVKTPEPGDEAPAEDPNSVGTRDSAFHGHYGYMLKLPPGYQASAGFEDANKTVEVVHLFPKGTNPTHLLHEGLYGDLGILRLEIAPRRVPQGFIGIDLIKAWAVQKLTQDKATFKTRQLLVNGMPAFITMVERPFKSATAYVVGQKVRYTFVGGEENDLFNSVLSSLVEVSPHDRPGS